MQGPHLLSSRLLLLRITNPSKFHLPKSNRCGTNSNLMEEDIHHLITNSWRILTNNQALTTIKTLLKSKDLWAAAKPLLLEFPQQRHSHRAQLITHRTATWGNRAAPRSPRRPAATPTSQAAPDLAQRPSSLPLWHRPCSPHSHTVM